MPVNGPAFRKLSATGGGWLGLLAPYGLISLWDSNDSTVIDTGGSVDSVSDLYGSNPLLGVGSNRLTIGTPILGRRVLEGAGNGFMTTTSHISLNVQEMWMFSVWANRKASGGAILITNRTAAIPTQNFALGMDSGAGGSIINTFNNVSTDLTGLGAGTNDGAVHFVALRENPASQRIITFDSAAGTFSANIGASMDGIFDYPDAPFFNWRLDGKWCTTAVGNYAPGISSGVQAAARVIAQSLWGTP